MADEKTESRLTELEIKISFQDSTIEALNSVVSTQQNQIDLLRREIAELKAQLTSADQVEKERVKPPHY